MRRGVAKKTQKRTFQGTFELCTGFSLHENTTAPVIVHYSASVVYELPSMNEMQIATELI